MCSYTLLTAEAKSSDSKGRMPGFESQFHNLVALGPKASDCNVTVPWCLHP